MNNSVQIYEPNDFGNGWGFYVDIENPYSTINKNGFVKEKYHKNYYTSREHKIDEDLEYYEYEYNKKREKEAIESSNNIIKTNSSSLLFHISSLTLITAAVSYCFIAAL